MASDFIVQDSFLRSWVGDYMLWVYDRIYYLDFIVIGGQYIKRICHGLHVAHKMNFILVDGYSSVKQQYTHHMCMFG